MSTVSFLGSVLDTIFPGRKWKREAERIQQQAAGLRHFQSILEARLQHIADASAREETELTRDEARRNARKLDRKNAWVYGFLNAVVNNIVGNGIRPEGAIRKRGAEGTTPEVLNDRLNRKIEERWARWAERASIDGKTSFYEMQRIAERELWAVGEAILVRRVAPKGDGREIPLALDLIDAARLDGGLTEDRKDGSKIVQGVEFNAPGRIVAYHILKDDPLGLNMTSRHERVPAEWCLHVFHPKRPGDVRGVSRLLSVATTFNAFDSWMDGELTAARTRTNLVGLLKSGSIQGMNLPKDQLQQLDEQGNQYALIGKGMIIQGSDQDSMEWNSPSIQAAGVEEFSELFFRQLAVGLGCSFSFLTRDHSRDNFSSSRQGQLEDRRHWEPRQEILVRKFCAPVFEWWKDMGRLANIPEFQRDLEQIVVAWHTQGWQWVKPLEEAQAVQMQIQMGLTSPQKEAARLGRDFYENIREKAEAEAWAAKQGTQLSLDGKGATGGLEDSQTETPSGKDTPEPSNVKKGPSPKAA